MPVSPILISVQEDAWRICVRREDGTTAIRDVAVTPNGQAMDVAVAAVLKELGCAGGEVVVGIPSREVLFARVNTEGLPRRQRRKASLYRLEEHLPVDVETLTAEFLPLSASEAMGVAVDTDYARGIMEQVESTGLEVAALCPTALLVLAHWVGVSPDADLILMRMGNGAELFSMRDDRIASWDSLPADTTAARRSIDAALLSGSPEKERIRLLACGEGAGDLAGDSHGEAIEMQRLAEPSLSEAACAVAERLLQGGSTPIAVDLCVDDLRAPAPWRAARTPLRLAAGLSCVLLALAAGVLLWKGWRSHQLEQDYRQQQSAQFRKLFPNSRVPTNVPSRLRSERDRLAGVSGEQRDIPVRTEGLETLRMVAESLPKTMRLRILEFRVSDSGLMLEGQVRSHGDAEVIFQSLRKMGFRVDPPRTEQLSGEGVAFTLVGKLPADSSGEGTP